MNNLIGLTIAGQYYLISLLWQNGSMGMYKSWDQKRSAYVALKLMRVNLDLKDDKIYFNHLLMESRILASLTHPNIVRFYELGQDGEFVFIAMEYIDGVTLKHWTGSRNVLSFNDLLVVLRPVCRTLHFLHSQGVIHADIKPDNILIGNNNQVVIVDFSIAYLTGSFLDERGSGTPRYMAPEQALGNLPLPQSDIYSLGVVLYEIVSGEVPFDGNVAPFDGMLSEKIKWEKINLPSPPLKNISKNIQFNVSYKFISAINKALSTEPEDRYSNALEFFEDIAHS